MRNDVPPRLSIDKDAVYPLKAFQQLTGLGDAAMRRARRQGLAVFKVGRQSFIRGADFYAFLPRLTQKD
jgi:hypothetical protein